MPGRLIVVSAERDELMRLVQALPEDQVGEALAEMRRHLRPVSDDRPWPPAFFAGAAGEPDTSSRVDELLREGFGR
jgi:hypothetical protein